MKVRPEDAAAGLELSGRTDAKVRLTPFSGDKPLGFSVGYVLQKQ